MIEQFEHDGQRVPITKIHLHPIHGAAVGGLMILLGLLALSVGAGMNLLWLQLVGASVFMSGQLLFFASGDATHEYVIQIRGGKKRTVTTRWQEL